MTDESERRWDSSNPDAALAEAEWRIELLGADDHQLDLGDLALPRLPESIGRLTGLRCLSLGQFLVNHRYDERRWTESRVHLHRPAKTITDLRPLAPLQELEALDLSHCGKLVDVSPLASLRKLNFLQFRDCHRLTDLSPLQSLNRLTYLGLANCLRLANLSPIGFLTALEELNLRWCGRIHDLSPIERLTRLTALNLSGCPQVSDLSSLRPLTKMKDLNLSGCEAIVDLSPLRSMAALQILRLDRMKAIRSLNPILGLLPQLRELYLNSCGAVDPPEAVHGKLSENVIDKVRAHYEDLAKGAVDDTEIVLAIVGNGGVGKTQLSRRLQTPSPPEPIFDPTVPSTHGIHFRHRDESLRTDDGAQRNLRLNLWDFGGQDLYHGSHALFLRGRQAVYLILWNPASESGHSEDGAGSLIPRRPLRYWVDYVRNFAQSTAPVLLVQSQCDSEKSVASPANRPTVDLSEFSFVRWHEFSARTRLGEEELLASVRRALQSLTAQTDYGRIGKGRAEVRRRLRELQVEDASRSTSDKRSRRMRQTEFDRLCRDVGGISDSAAFLSFLHETGVVFHDSRNRLFGGWIILDQDWALEAIYAVFDRARFVPAIRNSGRFTLEDLDTLVWGRKGYTPEEQRLFLKMMESCRVCFKTRPISPPGEFPERYEYIAPEMLPSREMASHLLAGRIDGAPAAKAVAKFAFLHDGIVRELLCEIGDKAGEAAVWWKTGCWFLEGTTSSRILIDASRQGIDSGRGSITLDAWGPLADRLIESVLTLLDRVAAGQRMEVERQAPFAGVETAALRLQPDSASQPAPRFEELRIVDSDVYFSYAWGEDTSDAGRHSEQVVDALYRLLPQWGLTPFRDKVDVRFGDRIPDFMRRIARAERLIAILSKKSLESFYCMREILRAYQHSFHDAVEFQKRIKPVLMREVDVSSPFSRLKLRQIWDERLKILRAEHGNEGEETRFVADLCNHWEGMLKAINDIRCPQSMEEAAKDEFRAVRIMLENDDRPSRRLASVNLEATADPD